MKQITTVIFLTCFLLVGCNNKPETDTTLQSETTTPEKTREDKEDRNRNVILEAFEGVNAHDVEKMFANSASDHMEYYDGSRPAAKGVDTLKAWGKAFFAAIPDVKDKVLEVVADDNVVMAYVETTGTPINDFMGPNTAGKEFKGRWVHIFKLNDEGKITEHRSVGGLTSGMQKN